MVFKQMISLILFLLFLGCSNGMQGDGQYINPQLNEKDNTKVELKFDTRNETQKDVLYAERFIVDPEMAKELLKQKEERSKPQTGLLKMSLETVEENEQLKINFSLQNISGKDLQISFGSGQQYDILVFNERNEEVYKWSNDKSFTQALIERDLKKGEKLTFTEKWNFKDNKGLSIAKGRYNLKVLIMVKMKSENITFSPDELTIKSEYFKKDY
jgi:hypothetical protein